MELRGVVAALEVHAMLDSHNGTRAHRRRLMYVVQSHKQLRARLVEADANNNHVELR